jgi:MFS transporter, DHA2 family, multidrug resistance protein
MNAVALIDQRTRTAPSPAAAVLQLSTASKVLALGTMCLGFFIAYLDIQIVAASIQEIGGGLSASQDEISWVQTSYLKFNCLSAPNRRS